MQTDGYYRLTVNWPEQTLNAEYIIPPVEKMFVIGDFVGWDLSQAPEMTPVGGKNGVFTWEGHLSPGQLRFSLNNQNWSELVQPTTADSPIGFEPVVDEKFRYPNSDNNNWLVQTDGYYRLTVNWPEQTLNAKLQQ